MTDSDSNPYGLKRYIPEGVKRAVRQRCRFGCVKCGAAIYEYHHFDPLFKDAREHRSEGITLLCGRCHGNVTRKVWSSELVVQYDRNPYCANHAPSVLLDLQAPLDLLMGSILLSGTGNLLTINGEALLAFDEVEGEGMALSATIRGDDGTVVVHIDRNELVFCAPAWDVTAVGPKFSVHRGPRETALEIVAYPPHGLHLTRLDLAFQNVRLVSDNKGRIDLSIAGGAAITMSKDHVAHVGGSIEFIDKSIQLHGGPPSFPFLHRDWLSSREKVRCASWHESFETPPCTWSDTRTPGACRSTVARGSSAPLPRLGLGRLE